MVFLQQPRTPPMDFLQQHRTLTMGFLQQHRLLRLPLLSVVLLVGCCCVYFSIQPVGKPLVVSHWQPLPPRSGAIGGKKHTTSIQKDTAKMDIALSPVDSRTRTLDALPGYRYLNETYLRDQLDFDPVIKYTISQDLLSEGEKEALETWSESDISRQPSRQHSRLFLVQRRKGVKRESHEELVTVRLDLRDSSDRQVRYGGHQVRMWITDRNRTKSAGLRVTDMRNGSYVTSFPVLWPGETTVRTELLFSRDVQRAMTRMVLSLKNPHPQVGVFVKGRVQQATLCGPFPVIPGFPDTCNLTLQNSGLEWYCGKPRRGSLTCGDWTWSRSLTYRGFPRPSQSLQEQRLVRWYHDQFSRENSNVTAPILTFSSSSGWPTAPKKRCFERKPRDTWADQSPQGFFFKQEWQHLPCRLPAWKAKSFEHCFANATFWFIGDSNARMMFNDICRLLRIRVTEAPKYRYKLHIPVVAHKKATHLSLAWFPHEYPLQSGTSGWTEVRAKRSPRFHMKQIPDRGNYVVLVHLYAHFAYYPSAVYTRHVRDVVQGVRDLHRRNPSAKVVIRGPHCWHNFVKGDYLASLASRVLKEEFRALRDSVYYLDVWGLTLAGGDCQTVHPPAFVTKEVTRLFLGYVCNAL